MSVSTDTLERAVAQREQARNQLRVALSTLEYIAGDDAVAVRAVAQAALEAVQEMQDRADD